MNSTDETNPPSITGSEHLGRRVTDQCEGKPKNLIRLLNRLKEEGGIPYQEFLPPLKLPAKISVVRLDQAPSRQVIADIAGRYAESDNKVFHGWVAVTAGFVMKLGFSTQPSPIHPPNIPNLYHADIVIPSPEEEARHERRNHAIQLEAKAKWIQWTGNFEIAPSPNSN